MPNPQSFTFPGELLPCDGSAVLCPDFIPAEVADSLYQSLLMSTPWESQSLVMFGKKVDEPRLSTWHAEPHLPYTYSGARRNPSPWTPELQLIRTMCEDHLSHTFNGVLVNLYRSGSDHLGWHSDDEKVNGPEPIIASISLGAERSFQLRHKETGEKVSTMLPHGSLLVMSGLSQSHWRHRVPKSPSITEPRINLTFRHLFTEDQQSLFNNC
jgi:alkylated DNA repair dioxygenase AlkB